MRLRFSNTEAAIAERFAELAATEHQARSAQLQLNAIPGWILYALGAWRDSVARCRGN